MGSLGSIVIPLVVAAVIGFVVGWFFARTGDRTEAAEPDLVPAAGSGTAQSIEGLSDAESATFDRRLAQLEADYSQRSDTFAKREAELTAAGRKLVEQLRHREQELGVLREQHEALDPEAAPVEVVEPKVEAVEVEVEDVTVDAVVAEDVDPEPVPPPVSAVSVEPSQIRSRRRSVIDPATGLPLGAEPTVSAPTADVDDPHMTGSSSAGEPDSQHGGVAKPDPQTPKLSVRMVGPRVRQDDPQIIDLRERRQARQVQKDDLTKLVGIGPKIAGELSDAGISSFARLARLDPDGPLPSSLEGLRGRMRRNGWIQQAEALAE